MISNFNQNRFYAKQELFIIIFLLTINLMIYTIWWQTKPKMNNESILEKLQNFKNIKLTFNYFSFDKKYIKFGNHKRSPENFLKNQFLKKLTKIKISISTSEKKPIMLTIYLKLIHMEREIILLWEKYSNFSNFLRIKV